MKSYLRKARKKLIASGSAQEYLLYAVGEILLVVIGILIALQINNANQNKKNKHLEKQYLIALKDEFLVNIDKLNVLDSLLGAQLKATNEFIQYTDPDIQGIDDDKFAYLLGEGFRDTYSYFPSSGVLKDLINSGKLGLISNTKLRQILADWDAQIIQLKEFEDEAKTASYQVVEILRTDGNFRNQMHGAFRALNTGPSPFPGSNTSLLNLEEFENSVVYFTGVSWRLKNVMYPALAKKMKDVVEIINTEIE